MTKFSAIFAILFGLSVDAAIVLAKSAKKSVATTNDSSLTVDTSDMTEILGSKEVAFVSNCEYITAFNVLCDVQGVYGKKGQNVILWGNRKAKVERSKASDMDALSWLAAGTIESYSNDKNLSKVRFDEMELTTHLQDGVSLTLVGDESLSSTTFSKRGTQFDDDSLVDGSNKSYDFE